MSTTLDKSFWPRLPITDNLTEKLLVEKLRCSTTTAGYLKWLIFLAAFYRSAKKPQLAEALLNMFLGTAEDPEQRAQCYLNLAQLAEDAERFDAALAHYLAAIMLQPANVRDQYLLHNNAAYCLNRLGRHAEAERHCRLAITIDSHLPYAYKNLGLSLQARGSIVSAAWLFVEAIKADRTDREGVKSLERLLGEHPEILARAPWAGSLSTRKSRARERLH